MEERLNKWLSRMGACSRREADRLIQEGKVLIDGKVAQMGQRVEDGQKVICDGKPVGDIAGGAVCDHGSSGFRVGDARWIHRPYG